MNKLQSYLQDNKINFTQVNNEQVNIDDTIYHLIQPDEEGQVITDQLALMTSKQQTDYYVFFFGGRYYYSEKLVKPDFNELKYVGSSISQTDIRVPFLGVHGAYEVLNGSRQYKDWINKAKFLKIDKLGILEKNTLAGTLKFQQECISNEITPIIGVTYTVYRQQEDFKYNIKLIVKNKTGWGNLLKINKEVMTVNNGLIHESKLLSLLNGIIPILDPKSLPYSSIFPLDFGVKYYQLDTVEYKNNKRDKEYLINLQQYYNSELEPVFITDAYYLDKEDSIAKKLLNEISGVREHEASNQYFKDTDDYFSELSAIFAGDENLITIFEKSISNLLDIVNSCNFLIETGKKHLPKYIMNEDEKKIAKNNYDLYWHYVEVGLQEKAPKEDMDKWIDRVQVEDEVIGYGGMRDYFLINRDQIRYCVDSNIITGTARGSAAGSLISYLLGITKINPFDYDLIFERFLTKSRAGKEVDDKMIILNTDEGEVRLWHDDLIKIEKESKEILIEACKLKENDIVLEY